MGKWGGIIARSLLAGGVGMAKGALDNVEEQNKLEAEKMREERLSSLRVKEHAANAQATADIKLAGVGKEAAAAAAPDVIENNRKIDEAKAKAEVNLNKNGGGIV